MILPRPSRGGQPMPMQATTPDGQRPQARPTRVLLVLGHPRRHSLCEALANAYAAGARDAGAELRRLSLADFAFEQNVLVPSPRDQPLEADPSDALRPLASAAHPLF